MQTRLVYDDCVLDRAPQRRSDADWLAMRMRDPASRVLPVWRDRSLVAGGERPQMVALSGDDALTVLQATEETIFLGVGEGGEAWFASDLPTSEEPARKVVCDGADFVDLGRIATTIEHCDGSLLAYARAMAYWHRRHRFCGVCGAATQSRQGGHLRVCTSPTCAAQSFPRTDPVVIMLVTRRDAEGGSCLLARQRTWMPGLVSALAGFVEPGETLETAVCREVREEVGLRVGPPMYVGSQPWPFPSSMMLGFRVEVVGDCDVTLGSEDEELEDARWYTRSEAARIRSLGLRLPHRGTMARALIDAWLAETEAVVA